MRVLGLSLHTVEPTQIGKFLSFERFCAVHKIWQIEVGGVIAGNDVWINFRDELAPRL